MTRSARLPAPTGGRNARCRSSAKTRNAATEHVADRIFGDFGGVDGATAECSRLSAFVDVSARDRVPGYS